MRGLSAIAVLGAAVFLSGAAPLLLKAPLPPGLVMPTAISVPEPKAHPTDLPTGDYYTCIRIDIGADGRVSDATMLTPSGNADIDAAALQQVRGIVYRPATLNGAPIAVRLMSASKMHIAPTEQKAGTGSEPPCPPEGYSDTAQ
jgi:TonB family protein